LIVVLIGCCLVAACTAAPPPAEVSEPSASHRVEQPSPRESATTTPVIDLAPPVPAQGPRPKGPSSIGARPPADFNGDGYTDLAVAKSEPIAADANGYGLVQVLYGSPTGFRPQASQQWSRASLGGQRGPSWFGWALTHGDINGDGISDLVVGDPGSTPDGFGAGDVHILYGAADGLSRARVQKWSLDSPGVAGRAKTGDAFGAAVAVGDLGRSSHDDLAIGMPARGGAGAAMVLFGSRTGLTADGLRRWDQGTAGIAGRPERYDRFGGALATGDFDGDQHDELVIGVAYDRIADAEGAGSVHVLHGSSDGPTADGAQHWTPGRNGLRGQTADTNSFGDAFAVGSFTGNGHLDLAIGSPGWSSIDTGSAGAVHVLYGSSSGLTAQGNQQWTEYDLGTRKPRDDQPEDHPGFGTALVAANFGRGDADDLVIGVPGALTPGLGSGAIQIVYGTPAGLGPAHSRQISQVTRGIKGFDYDGARFGSALSVLAPAAPDTYPTLAVGAPNYGGRDEYDSSGIVHLIRGSVDGLTTAQDQVLTPRPHPQEPAGGQFGRQITS
jgi:hypothetical protein